MTDPDTRILLDTLQQLEGELREAGWWEEGPPPPAALRSTTPFCADVLEFPQWLQWVFIPRLKALLEQGERLPGESRISPAAEVMLRHHPGALERLLPLLERLDLLLNRHCR